MGQLDNKELAWLWTHCSAIGMKRKSDSGKLEHDISLFTINQQDQIDTLRVQLTERDATIAKMREARNTLIERITDYLSPDGLFNSELADHDKHE